MTPDANFCNGILFWLGARAGCGGRGQSEFGNLEDSTLRLQSHVGNDRQGHVGNKIGLRMGRKRVSTE